MAWRGSLQFAPSRAGFASRTANERVKGSEIEHDTPWLRTKGNKLSDGDQISNCGNAQRYVFRRLGDGHVFPLDCPFRSHEHSFPNRPSKNIPVVALTV